MFFEIQLQDFGDVLLVHFEMGSRALEEIRNIDVDQAEKMTEIEEKNQREEKRSRRRNERQMKKTRDQDDEQTEENSTGNLNGDNFRIEFQFKHRRSASSEFR